MQMNVQLPSYYRKVPQTYLGDIILNKPFLRSCNKGTIVPFYHRNNLKVLGTYSIK